MEKPVESEYILEFSYQQYANVDFLVVTSVHGNIRC